VVALTAVIGCFVSPRATDGAPSVLLVDDSNPLAGRTFYVDPTSSAMVAAANAVPPSSELTAIASTPQAHWIGNEIGVADVAAYVQNYVGAAASASSLPILTLYAIPHRDCGGFTAGGFATGDEYRAWIDGVANGLGGAAVAIVLEPDALTAADCLPADQQQERYALLRYAVDALNRDPAAAVYIDGGHSRWLTADELARRLVTVGVAHARGFSLNTSNFFTTAEEITYGEAVSSKTNGAHYVVDTSRNGAGPAPDAPLNWCNPPGRALGDRPTSGTAGAHADAYLWIKHPGQSDGECDRGDPHTGLFMPDYAIQLAKHAGW
jgi:endoglucanase